MRQLAEAAPLADGSRLLHIGMPKAGSTALQGALHAARPRLTDHGVRFAGRGRHPFRAAAAAIGKTPPTGRRGNPSREWARLATELRTCPERLAVLSSETLSRADAEHARQIVDSIGGDDRPVHVVAVARPLALVLPSYWQQSVRNRTLPSFAEWLDQAIAVPPQRLAASGFARRFDLADLVQTWGKAVGEDNLTLVVLDPADRSHLLTTFERLLGLPHGTLEPQSRLTNQSLPYAEAELLRLINQRYVAGGGSLEEWAERIAPWVKPRVRDLRPPGPADRIRPPRWAVEAVNELTLPWIDAVRGSGITVVGDLDDLLADPATYDDVAGAPDVVPLATAAEIAYHFYGAGVNQRRSQPAPAPAKAAPEARLPRPGPTVAETPARELVREVGRRAVRRLRRR